jgi:hypothetical protein
MEVEAMHRVRTVIGIVGLVAAAAAARAAAPPEVTLFGQKYSVKVQAREGVYKNGTKITAQNDAGSGVDTVKKANVSFAEGADVSKDRLFVVAPIGTDSDGPTGDEFYSLTGTDDTGLFSTTNSTATQYFGGNLDHNAGGRGQTVAWLGDQDAGKHKDKNIAMFTFTGADGMHFYDLDSVNGPFEDEGIVVLILYPGDDENMPSGSWVAPTRAPNGFMVAVGGSGSWQMGVMDPTKDTFFTVLTDLSEATKATGKEIQHVDIAHGLARFGADEYWVLSSVGDPGGNNDEANGEQYLTRLKVTFPADFSQAKAGSIKAELVGQEEIFAKGMAGSPGGMLGVAIGREIPAGSGKRVIYMSDWAGNLITLRPE